MRARNSLAPILTICAVVIALSLFAWLLSGGWASLCDLVTNLRETNATAKNDSGYTLALIAFVFFIASSMTRPDHNSQINSLAEAQRETARQLGRFADAVHSIRNDNYLARQKDKVK